MSPGSSRVPFDMVPQAEPWARLHDKAVHEWMVQAGAAPLAEPCSLPKSSSMQVTQIEDFEPQSVD